MTEYTHPRTPTPGPWSDVHVMGRSTPARGAPADSVREALVARRYDLLREIYLVEDA